MRDQRKLTHPVSRINMIDRTREVELFVPGRVCLFGEHSDWAGTYRKSHPQIAVGEAILCGTNSGIYARATQHPSHLVLRSMLNGEIISAEFPNNPQTLLDLARSNRRWAYIAGVAYQIGRDYDVAGIAVDNYYTDLPVKKGLSSSAAICVLVARAYNQLYDLGLTIEQEMEYAYLGEITTLSQCGRLDQGCAFGQVPIKMRFDGDDVSIEPLEVGGDFYLVVVDLCAGKDTKRILDDLNRCYPDAQDEVARNVQMLFGAINQEIVAEALRLLRIGDAYRLGRLMTKAQQNFDKFAMPASPAELCAPILHQLLADSEVQALSWGGKGVGSQGDGSAQLVARGRAEQQALIDLAENKFSMHGLAMTIQPTI